MGFGRLEDVVAHQFAEEFKLEVYGLIDASPGARGDFKFRNQLRDAASGISAAVAEGFGRQHPPEFVTFLRYALASLAEAKTHLKDGIDRGYFAATDWSLSGILCVGLSMRSCYAPDETRAAASGEAGGRSRRDSGSLRV